MKMKQFTLPISTSKKQSERLISLGLKLETADMVYHYTKSKVPTLEWELKPYPPTLRGTTKLNVEKLAGSFHKHPDGSLMTGEEVFNKIWGKDIPAWSLSRLMSILPEKIIYDNKVGGLFMSHTDISYFGFYEHGGLVFLFGYSISDDENVYDICIDMIEYLIKLGYLDKEYLV